MKRLHRHPMKRGLLAALMVALLPTLAAAATYEIDSVHSSAIFKIKHFGVSNFYGAFAGIEGTVEYEAAQPDSMGIDVTIDAASVATRNERRNEHVKSPDFLSVAEFPVITFKSTEVTLNDDGTLEVTGNLTLHGVTREIRATAEKTGEGTHPRSGNELVGFEARFTVDRTEFDMNFMVGPLSEEVDFILSLEAGKAAE